MIQHSQNHQKHTFYSNGKLLLTGEYVVLDGALALAVPTRFGQSLTIEPIDGSTIIWKSVNHHGNIWFEDEFRISDNTIVSLSSNDQSISKQLIKILEATKQLRSGFLIDNQGIEVTTILDFPQDWGLGSSSTLINNIASWAQVDAYQLLDITFGGSGYDIACAQHHKPITYQLEDDHRSINEVVFNPSFKEHLYFVYLNKKQNSREGIAHYKTHVKNSSLNISEISKLTTKMINCQSLEDFENLINSHESIISNMTKQQTVKAKLFNDFKGSIKSLGAWGGDFVLVSSNENPEAYFKNKGFETVLSFEEMVSDPLE